MQSLGKKVYLCGPINGCTDEEAKDWRDYCAKKLDGICFDPMVRDYRGRELEPGIASEIVENDKSDILQCDSLLVYYEKPSVGTSMEVLFAYDNGIPAIVVDKSGKPLSPWLVYHSSAVFSSLDAAVSFLNERTA
ncbi:nucleoside 2-deoxyribosyltransferase [Bosea sp. AS-1]|uniref:nucleoside 2-deoxyribosyltransferase n=1 Tax=Bosea sp. AS-1 TaxID=2015316 RepID=UPI000B776AF2|nr:nucleoside 2-deoxyribosyltransferase [Bosea sp. AS-1]